MNKFIVGATTALAFLLPIAASAMVNVQNISFDGFANATANVGDTLNAKVTYTIGGNEDVECLTWELVGSGLSPVPVNIPDQINNGTFHPEFDMDTSGATAGNWDVKIRLYGDNGPGADQGCNGPVQDTMNFPGRVSILETSGNNTGTGVGNGTGNANGSNSGGSNSVTAALQAQIASLTALVQSLLHPTTTPPASTPAPTTDIQCAAFAAANMGTQPNVYNDGNRALQGYLLSQHMSIPALTSGGAAFGFYGNQTTTAVGAWRSMHPTCI